MKVGVCFENSMSTKVNISDEELRNLYESGISIYELAKKFKVNKKTISSRLQKFSDWEELKWKNHGLKIKTKQDIKKYKGVCKGCGIEFTHHKTKKFCNYKCYKRHWGRINRSHNKDKINKLRRERRAAMEKKKTTRKLWLEQFEHKAGEVHKRKLDKFAQKIDNRCASWKNSLVSRSKKANVECNITIDELRTLMYNNYGTSCKYCGRKMDINNLVIDHIIPLSKGGTSNIDNLQIICKTSNSMKGSLDEKNFQLLLDWLNNEAPEELKIDLSIRLARGIH
jgi:5-methylcytosine-specific restriction endonuclease McrA